MERVLYIVFFSGLIAFAFFGFEWFQSKQEVVTLSADQISNAEENVKRSSQSQDEDVSLRRFLSEDRVMSDERNEYKPGAEVASLLIPAVEEGYPVYWGADDVTLKQGVGMYVSEWTTTPEVGGHTVVSGHRDSVFTKLGEVTEGDDVLLEFEGETYVYSIKNIWITAAEDRTVIVDKESPTLTITTCYPLDYLGSAPDRYIIQAELTGVHK
ncbi:sortase [Alteribacter keqinensis]|nr:sortase [Alteribacter keqinensis]